MLRNTNSNPAAVKAVIALPLVALAVLLLATQTITTDHAAVVVAAFVPVVMLSGSSSYSSSTITPPRSLSMRLSSTHGVLLLPPPRQRRQSAIAASWRLHATAVAITATAPAVFDETCDVLVLGSGPAARAISSLLAAGGTADTAVTGNNANNGDDSRQRLSVIMADQNLDRLFPPNYGAWHDEWDAVVQRYAAAGVVIRGGRATTTGGKNGDGNSAEAAIDRTWNVTDCFFGGSFGIPVPERTRNDRAYYRIDKDALRESLTPPPQRSSSYRQLRASHFSTAIAPNIYAPAGSLVHDADGTTVQLRRANGSILTVRTKLVVDCTGHETKLVLRESTLRGEPSQPPGYQIAYGCLVDVECDNDGSGDSSRIGPYDKEAMTLFDYRTDHYDSESTAAQQRVAKSPTFMYAMPLQGNQVFFEETSLVARPALSFQECKDRTMQRLAYHGIRVTKLYEEEFCYIPMGGALPARDQRILALGGAAAMVHPATGYHLCRCMMGAGDVAEIVLRELLFVPAAAAAAAQQKATGQSPINLDRVAASAYHALWSPSNIRQRNFAVFGGEYLMKQNVVGLRGLFDGFFRLPLPLWAGFLAGWPGLPNNEKHETWFARLWFGLNFVYRLPPSVAVDMFASIVTYIATTNLALAQSVTPLLGEPASYEYKPNKDIVGDVAAKSEARRMILESKVVDDVPVDFIDAKDETPMQEAMPTARIESVEV